MFWDTDGFETYGLVERCCSVQVEECSAVTASSDWVWAMVSRGHIKDLLIRQAITSQWF